MNKTEETQSSTKRAPKRGCRSRRERSREKRKIGKAKAVGGLNALHMFDADADSDADSYADGDA